MVNYHENPKHNTINYAIFLIRRPEALTSGLLDKIHNQTLAGRSIVSFERLVKGSREALVVFGPAVILRPLINTLDLLELEEYSKRVDLDDKGYHISAWEVGAKAEINPSSPISNLKYFIPVLTDSEEFWWQLILKPAGNNFSDARFYTTIRVVLRADNTGRAQELKEHLSKTGGQVGLTPLPQTYTSSQTIKFYQERAFGRTPFSKKSETGVDITLTPGQVQALLGLTET